MDSEKEKISCQICCKTFSTASYRDRHMRIHTGEKPYSCDICEKSFTTSHGKDYHMRTHTGEKPYSCQICGKSFSQSSDKSKHMRTHSGEKPYSCKICGKLFSQSDSKDKQMRIHTGEKPYSCQICKKSFATSSDKNRHMRTHTGEKPYSCQICKKSFTTSSDKNRHMRTHTGEKPYSCDICGKSFLRKETKDIHKKKHTTGKKLDTSDKCSKSSLDVNKYKTVHKYIYNGLLSTMKPVCVKLRKLSTLEIKSCSEINYELSVDSISEEETLNKDPLTIQIDGTITTVVEETKEKDLYPINTRFEIKTEQLVENVFVVLTTKDEPLNNDDVIIMNVKEEVKEEETLADDSHCIKDKPAFIDIADADVNVKEEETGDYFYDSDNIDHSEVYENINEIDIKDFKLEEPDF